MAHILILWLNWNPFRRQMHWFERIITQIIHFQQCKHHRNKPNRLRVKTNQIHSQKLVVIDNDYQKTGDTNARKFRTETSSGKIFDNNKRFNLVSSLSRRNRNSDSRFALIFRGDTVCRENPSGFPVYSTRVISHFHSFSLLHSLKTTRITPNTIWKAFSCSQSSIDSHRSPLSGKVTRFPSVKECRCTWVRRISEMLNQSSKYESFACV